MTALNYVTLYINTLFITIPIVCKAQTYTDHLIPDSGIYGIFDYQFDYYSNVRKVLFKELSDKPEIRLLVMPSFTPENVLDIQKNNKDGNYYLVYPYLRKNDLV